MADSFQAPRDRADDGPAVLLVSGSHGFPPTRARFARLTELAGALSSRGARCDVVVLLERRLQPAEEDALDRLRSTVHDLEVLSHPSTDSIFFQAVSKAKSALSIQVRLGGRSHCPPRLASRLRARHAEEHYRAVIASGAYLAPVLRVFPDWTEKLVDLERIGSDTHRDHERQGRGDALQIFSDAEREIELLRNAGCVLVASGADAARLRALGYPGEVILAPPTGGCVAASAAVGASTYGEPVRPPRILCVGSETVANLDGLRWFRRQVFPRIARAVPSCRLRLVGEVARHLEPGPSIDRIGWVDRLAEEYRDAALVALPIRMGAGVHRRAVEALASGKALATTGTGAAGLDLEAQRDAIVTDDAAVLAQESIRTLHIDSVRRGYERRALALSDGRFSRERAFAPLAQHLGLEARNAAPRASLAALLETV